MAPSFSSAKTVSAFITNQFSVALTKSRGYAVASQCSSASSTVRSGAPNIMSKKTGSEESAKISWVPDPVTGYYRPENRANEIDAAELREMLVKSKARRQ